MTTSSDFTYVNNGSNYLTPAESNHICPTSPPPPTPPLQLPKIIWHADPIVKLKLRKQFFPLALTRLTLGADLDVRTREVNFKWSWKDRIIGGRIEFHSNQIAITKRVTIDERTKLDVRAAFDVEKRRALFSLNIKPFWGIVATRPPNGLSFKQRVPLDRRVSLEALGRVTLPEARFSNETAVSLGEGDFEVYLDQLNIRLMVQ